MTSERGLTYIDFYWFLVLGGGAVLDGGLNRAFTVCVFQAWKSADLTPEQKEETEWQLRLGPNIGENELKMAMIRNQGELLENLRSQIDEITYNIYSIRFENDIRPEQTLTIDLWNCKSLVYLFKIN